MVTVHVHVYVEMVHVYWSVRVSLLPRLYKDPGECAINGNYGVVVCSLFS